MLVRNGHAVSKGVAGDCMGGMAWMFPVPVFHLHIDQTTSACNLFNFSRDKPGAVKAASMSENLETILCRCVHLLRRNNKVEP
jgi:hypothetical protein